MKFTLTDLRKYFNVDLRDNDNPQPKGQPITPEQAAFWAGISLQTWNKIEQGKTNPRKSTLEKISKKFRVNIDDIVVGQGKPEEQEEQEEQVTEPATVNDEEQKQTTNNQEEETKMKKVTLTQLRAQYELTQEQAAKKAHVTVQTWNNVEKGLHKPQVNTLAKIAKAFGIQLEDIVSGTNAEQTISDDYNGHKPYQKDGFVINVYGDSRNPIIEKHTVYDHRTPVYIKAGAFIQHAFLSIKNVDEAISLRDDAAIASPSWLDNYKNLLWVNTKTGQAMYDCEFKLTRIDRAADLWNKKKEKKTSPFTFMNRMVSGFSNWKPVVVPTSLKEEFVEPLTLLPLAVQGLPEKDRTKAIEDAIHHVEQGSTVYDSVFESYFVDKDDNLFDCKQINTEGIKNALAIWNDPKLKTKYDSFYGVAAVEEVKAFRKYRSFDEVHAEIVKEDRDNLFNPFYPHTDAFDKYEDYLIYNDLQGTSIKNLITDRFNCGVYDGHYLGYYLEYGDIDLDDVIDILKGFDDDLMKLDVLQILLTRLDINYEQLKLFTNNGVISEKDEHNLYDWTHEQVEKERAEIKADLEAEQDD